MTERSVYVNRFPEVLSFDGPAPDRASKMMLYGQFVGSWDLQVVDYEPDGSRWEGVGEVHFAWVLEGRAIQDVWISPPRDIRKSVSTTRNTYGTTLRVYDPQIDAWHILWINPITQSYNTMIGRKIGDEIVQEYRDKNGTLNQWIFSEITPKSFHWIGRSFIDADKSWNVETEFFARRRDR
jgi:hypothetical protein